MGKTLKKLGSAPVEEKTIFPHRFVIEICEAVHLHYRNLRILLSKEDWIALAQGCADSLKRWRDQGEPEPEPGRHIELCRKRVASDPLGDQAIKVNLNENLYTKHEGRIFSEGADFEEAQYIHLKIRDLRLELSKAEFFALAKAVGEAVAELNAEAVSG